MGAKWRVVNCCFLFKQKTAYEMLRSLVGSEMCIRDRRLPARHGISRAGVHLAHKAGHGRGHRAGGVMGNRGSAVLGGPRGLARRGHRP